ncbi:MAG TPA: bifunctional glycosyltransferase/class I SAM-dependent methyltransferase [Propylenella sp.]|nr:bifunctional glycosyltransferase/class I SAM-dependent methyltransferase [Propylenella sp.]
MSDLMFPTIHGTPAPILHLARPLPARPRLLILIVAYNAESTIRTVLERIPASIAKEYEVEVLVTDDASTDRTFDRGRELVSEGSFPFPLTVLCNPVNQGYGGNQKIGYFYAIKKGFDFVALLHGDGQYAPECLPDLLRPLRDGQADASFGSRMMEKGSARRGGMPGYKFLGNRVLSWFENRLLRTSFTEFHSGYRLYSVPALKRIPFARNTDDFHFDTEIIIQFVLAGMRIVERPIPTYYGDEICRVNGLKYAWNVAKAVLKARAQELGLLYDRRFDVAAAGPVNAQYRLKADYDSPHAFALELIPEGARVLDLGCAGGYMGALLKEEKACRVVGVDVQPVASCIYLDEFRQHDLNEGPPDLALDGFDHILMLDVIEHLSEPEKFMDRLQQAMSACPEARLVLSTGNIGFVVTRLMLLFGQLNYGKRGILDMTHTRLFTFTSLRRLVEQSGFRIVEVRGVPGPFPLAMGSTQLSRFLLRLNRALIAVSRGMFSYQIFMVLQPRPSLEYLLRNAEEQSAIRARECA